MSDIEYKCVECDSTSIVSENYLRKAYVKAKCCSVFCYRKISILENAQEDTFELEITDFNR